MITDEEKQQIKDELRAEVFEEVMAILYLYNDQTVQQFKNLSTFLRRNFLGNVDA